MRDAKLSNLQLLLKSDVKIASSCFIFFVTYSYTLYKMLSSLSFVWKFIVRRNDNKTRHWRFPISAHVILFLSNYRLLWIWLSCFTLGSFHTKFCCKKVLTWTWKTFVIFLFRPPPLSPSFNCQQKILFKLIRLINWLESVSRRSCVCLQLKILKKLN